jgi:hypothetical protein
MNADLLLIQMCVRNKMIAGSQCTLNWHIDDLKISHLNPHVVSNLIKMLDVKWGQEAQHLAL